MQSSQVGAVARGAARALGHAPADAAGAVDARRSRARRADHRRERRSTSCRDVMAQLAAAPGTPVPSVATGASYNGQMRMYSRVGSRPHHDRPQLSGRRVRAGAAPARRHLRRRRRVPPARARRRRDRGRHRPRHRSAARHPRRISISATSTTSRSSPAATRRPSFSRGRCSIALAAADSRGDLGAAARGVESVRVTLHESHVASASYEAPLS